MKIYLKPLFIFNAIILHFASVQWVDTITRTPAQCDAILAASGVHAPLHLWPHPSVVSQTCPSLQPAEKWTTREIFDAPMRWKSSNQTSTEKRQKVQSLQKSCTRQLSLKLCNKYKVSVVDPFWNTYFFKNAVNDTKTVLDQKSWRVWSNLSDLPEDPETLPQRINHRQITADGFRDLRVTAGCRV